MVVKRVNVFPCINELLCRTSTTIVLESEYLKKEEACHHIVSCCLQFGVFFVDMHLAMCVDFWYNSKPTISSNTQYLESNVAAPSLPARTYTRPTHSATFFRI